MDKALPSWLIYLMIFASTGFVVAAFDLYGPNIGPVLWGLLAVELYYRSEKGK